MNKIKHGEDLKLQTIKIHNSDSLLQATSLQTTFGFTSLELLIALTIIGILAATAIPSYQDYVKKAFDARARSDLLMVALAEEAYFSDYEAYQNCSDSECAELPGVSKISKGVTIQISATASGFQGEASHHQGSGKVFSWISSEGGLQE